MRAQNGNYFQVKEHKKLHHKTRKWQRCSEVLYVKLQGVSIAHAGFWSVLPYWQILTPVLRYKNSKKIGRQNSVLR